MTEHGGGEVAVDGNAWNQSATESILRGDAVVVDFVFRICRGIDGPDAKRLHHQFDYRRLIIVDLAATI
jgi:hypothetical protein